MMVYVYVGHSRLIGPAGKWKALQVAFITAGGQQAGIASIEEVATPDSGASTLTFAEGGNFFGMVQLEGGQYPNGHAVTVTFEESVDMGTLQVDLTSFNTYIVQREDYACVAQEGSPCPALPALYFGGEYATLPSNSPGFGFVVLAGSESPYDLYAYAQETEITQVSVGFKPEAGAVDTWTYETASYGTWAVAGPGVDGFGIWQPSGGTLPTNSILATITVPDGTDIGPLIDVDNGNSNMEDVQPVGSPLRQYNPLVYVYGAPKPSFYNPCATCEAIEGTTSTNQPCSPVQGNGETYCALDSDPSRRCYLGAEPCLGICDSYGAPGAVDPSNPLYALLGLCVAQGDKCWINDSFGDCYSGDSLCRPPTCYVPEGSSR